MSDQEATSDLPDPSPSSSSPTRYVVISPVRDEGQHIAETIKSVVKQTIRPIQWVIVDDGSTDATATIAQAYATRYPWMSCIKRPDRGFRAPGCGVIEAFDHGYDALAPHQWEFVVKLDGDLILEHDYFERCFKEFERDPQLGIGGGTLFHLERGVPKIEVNPLFHVRGATKIYRAACWRALGGLLRAPGWDTVDEVKAHMLGWRTRSFPHLKVLHLRATGAMSGTWKDAVKNGRGDYIAGYHPLFMIAKCLRNALQKPYIVLTAGLLYGFLGEYVRRAPRVQDKTLIEYLRRQQLRRLFLRKSIWK